jgi:maltodextrin utilization protein YvdJ
VTLTIVLSLPVIPLVNAFARALPEKVLSTYPDELTLHFEKGVLSSNMTEPYFIGIPLFLRVEMKENEYAHLVVIDTDSTVTPEQFAAYQAPLWLARTNAVVVDSNHSIKIQPYGTQTSFTLSETLLEAFFVRIEPYFVWAPLIVVLLLFFPLLAIFLFHFVYLIFGALLIFLLGRFILKQEWSYGTAYRIGLHALTLPILIDLVLSVLSSSIHSIPFLPTLLLLIVVYTNYKPAERIPETPSQAVGSSDHLS